MIILKKEWYKTWWGVLLIIAFYPILGTYLIWKKTTWKKQTKIISTAVLLITAAVSGIVFSISDSNLAKTRTEAVKLAAEGKTDEAVKLLNSSDVSDKDSLIKQINMLNNREAQVNALETLNDDEYNQLKAGTLNAKFKQFTEESLNAAFINNIKNMQGLEDARKTVVAVRKEKELKEKIKDLFSAWDGSNKALTEAIKKSMNDPKSYEHNETKYTLSDKDGKKVLVISQSFRGKNAFGGVVLNTCLATQDIETGALLEVSCE